MPYIHFGSICLWCSSWTSLQKLAGQRISNIFPPAHLSNARNCFQRTSQIKTANRIMFFFLCLLWIFSFVQSKSFNIVFFARRNMSNDSSPGKTLFPFGFRFFFSTKILLGRCVDGCSKSIEKLHTPHWGNNLSKVGSFVCGVRNNLAMFLFHRR